MKFQQSQPVPEISTNLILFSLACIAVYVWAADEHCRRLGHELAHERTRRLDAEQHLNTRDQQFDGALDELHTLSTRMKALEHTDPAAQPQPEPADG